MNEIQDRFYKFLWDGKPDKFRRNVITNNYEEEGLALPHVESFCKALHMSWIHKLLDPMNMSPWKIVMLSYIEKYGGDKILYLKRRVWKVYLISLINFGEISILICQNIFFIIDKYCYNGVFFY